MNQRCQVSNHKQNTDENREKKPACTVVLYLRLPENQWAWYFAIRERKGRDNPFYNPGNQVFLHL